MSDNGPTYVSETFAKACRTLGLLHSRCRPYTPRVNGKAERFISTLCLDWACAKAFANSEERNHWPPSNWPSYDWFRKYLALTS